MSMNKLISLYEQIRAFINLNVVYLHWSDVTKMAMGIDNSDDYECMRRSQPSPDVQPTSDEEITHPYNRGNIL
jgi:hypothetical protein